MKRNINKRALLRSSLGFVFGLYLGSNAVYAKTVENFSLYRPNDSESTLEGHIDYVTVGASFRTTNGNFYNVNNQNIKDLELACSFKNPEPTFQWGTANFTTTNGAVVTTADRVNPGQIVPNGAKVKAAYLYWSGSSYDNNPSSWYNLGNIYIDKQVEFYIDNERFVITADKSWAQKEIPNPKYTRQSYSYGSFASLSGRVLETLREKPNADLMMNDLSLNNDNQAGAVCESNAAFGNWWLYIIYEDPNISYKKLFLKHGLGYAKDNIGDIIVNANNLNIPEAGSSEVSKITVVASEGDPNLPYPNNANLTNSNNKNLIGDNLVIDINKNEFIASTTHRDRQDFFKGFISVEKNGIEEIQKNTTPDKSDSIGGGLDIAIVDISNKTSMDTNSITVKIPQTPQAEMIVVHNIAILTTISQVDLSLDKKVLSENGSPEENVKGEIGEEFTFLYTIKNDGPNTLTEAYKVQLEDKLPAGLEYVSSQVGYNDNNNDFTRIKDIDAKDITVQDDGTIIFPPIHRLDKDGSIYLNDGDEYPINSGGKGLVYKVVVRTNGKGAGKLENSAKVTSGSYDINPDNNTNTASVTIDGPALKIEKTDNDQTFPTAYIGKPGLGQYIITVTNTGNLPTEGPITIKEALPNGVQLKAIKAITTDLDIDQKADSEGTQIFTFTPKKGTLAPGESIKLELLVDVNIIDARQVSEGKITNHISVGGGGTPDALDPNSCNVASPRCDEEETSLGNGNSKLNVGIEKDGPTKAKIGEEVTYTIKVYNLSGWGNNITNLTIIDELPDYFNYTSSSCREVFPLFGRLYYSCGTEHEPNNSTEKDIIKYIGANIGGNSPSEGYLEITVTGKISSNIKDTEISKITNVAKVILPDGKIDSDLSNNTATATTEIIRPILKLEKTTPNSIVSYNTKNGSGESIIKAPALEYHIKIENTGSATATNVKLEEKLPKGLEYLEISKNGGNSTSTWDGSEDILLPDIDPGKSLNLVVKAKAPDPKVLEKINNFAGFKNTATVTATDANTPTDSATIDAVYTKLEKTVQGPNDTGLVKSNTASPGDVLVYCIDYYNYGNIGLKDYVIKDSAPKGTSYIDINELQNGKYKEYYDKYHAYAKFKQDGDKLKADIGSLEADKSGKVCFTAKVNDGKSNLEIGK